MEPHSAELPAKDGVSSVNWLLLAASVSSPDCDCGTGMATAESGAMRRRSEVISRRKVRSGVEGDEGLPCRCIVGLMRMASSTVRNYVVSINVTLDSRVPFVPGGDKQTNRFGG